MSTNIAIPATMNAAVTMHKPITDTVPSIVRSVGRSPRRSRCRVRCLPDTRDSYRPPVERDAVTIIIVFNDGAPNDPIVFGGVEYGTPQIAVVLHSDHVAYVTAVEQVAEPCRLVD